MYDITTGTGDFIANGVVSHNCFARPTHEYLELDAGRDFEREIVVKVNVPEVLRAELRRPSWKGESVALGTNTDPYQWVEGRYKLMRGIWEAFRDYRNPCSVLTKSPLLLRDLDLMKEIAAVTDVSACLSVPTLDEKAWRATEPHTPHPRARLEAVAELNRNGIPTGVLMAPLIPASTTHPSRWSGSSRSRPRRTRPTSAARPCSSPARSGRSSSTGCASTARTSCRATSASTRSAPGSHPPSATRSRARPARRGCAGRDLDPFRRHRGGQPPPLMPRAGPRAPGKPVLERREPPRRPVKSC